MWVKTHNIQNQWGLCFLCIAVRFHAYLFIFIHGKTLLIFLLSWHIHLMSVVEVKTQTRFMVLFTSGSLLIWGKSLDSSPGVSPRYMPATYSHLIISPFLLQTSHHDRVCLFLTKSRLMEKRDGSNVGGHQHLPFAVTVSNSLPFPSKIVLPEQP